MQFKMNEVQLPEKISFNYQELKTGLLEKASKYEAMVYGDDEIKTAKADKAALNKLKKALNDERIRQEKEYMKPFNEFKSQVNEIISIIDQPIKAIDGQIKAYEAEKKRIKEDCIYAFWDSLGDHDWLTLDKIWNSQWLNASVSMKKVKEEIKEKLLKITSDMDALNSLPEFSFEAIETYKDTLDINRAISEGKRLAEIQKRKAEQEAARIKAEEEKAKAAEEQPKVVAAVNVDAQEVPPAEIPAATPEKSWVRFEAYMTVEQAMKLKEFFETNGISFRAI